MDLLKMAQQVLQLDNTQAPIVGPIRKAMFSAFGQPDYTKSQLSATQRAMDLINRSAIGLDSAIGPKPTVQFGRNVSGGGNQELMLIDQTGKHVSSRFYDSASNIQKALDRIALPEGWQAWPREVMKGYNG